jgi:hypothetical protein
LAHSVRKRFIEKKRLAGYRDLQRILLLRLLERLGARFAPSLSIELFATKVSPFQN